jgi:flagellar FliJ protein
MYRFRLEPVLQFRRRLEEVAQMELSKKIGECENELLFLQSLIGEQNRCIQEIKLMEKDSIPVEEYRMYKEYTYLLFNRIKEQQKRIESLRGEVEEKRNELIGHSKNRKILEKMKERGRIKYQKDWARKEEKSRDELTTIRFDRDEMSMTSSNKGP